MAITSDQIKTVIKNQIRNPKLDLSDGTVKLDDLGIDSLDVVEILLSIEEEHNVIVMEDQLKRGCNLSEFISTIEAASAA